jgi:hypothetical protein
MKHAALVVFLFFCTVLLSAAADTAWDYGRIVEVRRSVNTRTQAWVANTPIYQEIPVYTITVHLKDKLLTGNYQQGEKDSPPPEEWTPQYPVEVQLQGDVMYVRGPTGPVRLHLLRRKPAAAMLPLTAEEKKNLTAVSVSPQESLIGFSKDTRSSEKSPFPPPAADVPAPAPAAAPAPSTGTVTVRSTPYLSEVFVDGESMGYTPAKINLPPGKHSFRVEKNGYKPWTKELTLTVGSELTLDASLEKK